LIEKTAALNVSTVSHIYGLWHLQSDITECLISITTHRYEALLYLTGDATTHRYEALCYIWLEMPQPIDMRHCWNIQGCCLLYQILGCKSFSHHHDLNNHYGISCVTIYHGCVLIVIITMVFFPHSQLITCVCDKSTVNMMGAISRAGTAYPYAKALCPYSSQSIGKMSGIVITLCPSAVIWVCV
jgi:hypothetical protein